ncbi:MAG: carbohydrate ABC transporter permease [Candidatus Oleimicrobiaceae bacterium]
MERRRPRVSRLAAREYIEGYFFISPWMLGFLVFTLGPILGAMYVSLTEYRLIAAPEFIGLGNYGALIKDRLFWHSLKITAIYAFSTVLLRFATGLGLAVMLNQKLVGKSIYRTIFYMPTVVTGVTVAVMWKWFFDPTFGAPNSILRMAGLQGPMWFAEPRLALLTFIMLDLWASGRAMILYLAGLQNVPTELYEAADVDGAGALVKFGRITLPMISPVILYQIIMGIIGSFQVFTTSYVITGGGPANATLFYVLYLYFQAFEYWRMGYASALAVVLFAMILMVTLFVWWSSGRWVFYQGELVSNRQT